MGLGSDDIRTFLQQRGVAFTEKDLPFGTQFRCPDGEVFSSYTSGKLVIQGKAGTELAGAVGALSKDSEPVIPSQGAKSSPKPIAQVPVSKRIFIVYGHDQTATDALELMLRRWGIEPVILQNLPAAGDTIIEKLEHYLGETGNVGFACVLLTPDDVGRSVSADDDKYRARQNVILELGMVLARLGRKRVAILHKESVELPSDIAGLLYIAFKERVEEAQNRLLRDLKAAGYEPAKDY